ncbi:hypothetical protein JW851_00755 [Candidatus Woesearchaeota archaeon]|nr:hypothetical protein [Candidatus Woesearchaeota archaeon]
MGEKIVGFDGTGWDLEAGIKSCTIADRNFRVGDRVKTFFKGKWVEGTIVEKTIPKSEIPCVVIPYILIKTDEKIDDAPDAYLNGYGIRGPVSRCRSPTYFIHEKVPNGDEIYSARIEFKMSREEIDEMEKELEEPPF